jgi:neutral ceramidase
VRYHPLQIMRIGSLFRLGVPGEFTTMAGRRLRSRVQHVLRAHGVQGATVVIAGLANSYGGYITTWQEYQAQRYEAASTLYGPHELAAYLQQFSLLADAWLAGTALPPGPQQPDYSKQTFNLLPAGAVDTVPAGHKFGDVARDVNTNKTHGPGDIVSAQFWCANPRNSLRTDDTFLQVQRKAGGSGAYELVSDDSAWATKFKWDRHGASASLCTVEWTIPAAGTARAGVYRLMYSGNAKTNEAGTLIDISGYSSQFGVTA